MQDDSQIRSLARFLYTQNPFYLLSCFLILYGLQTAAVAQGDLYERVAMLCGGIAIYTLLMAAAVVFVVRLCKVWQDARSIFLIIVIGMVAISVSFDELCINNPVHASWVALLGFGFSVLVTEGVLRICALPFPMVYRVSFYAMIAVMFASPAGLGWSVQQRIDTVIAWASGIYSMAFAMSMLLLIPAMHAKQHLIRTNPTPWKWPLYPLSMFFILIVLAGMRTHAVWMSFSFLGASVRFEPLLLLPLLVSVIIVVAEVDIRRKKPRVATLMVFLSPLILLCGWQRIGGCRLPFNSDLTAYVGGGLSCSLISLALLTAYFWARGIKVAAHLFVGSLLGMYYAHAVPPPLVAYGFHPLILLVLATAIYWKVCLEYRNSDFLWFIWSAILTFTVYAVTDELGQRDLAIKATFVCGLLSAMTLGAIFKTELASILRNIAGIIFLVGSVVFVVMYLVHPLAPSMLLLPGAACLVSLIYSRLVYRSAWLWVAAAYAISLAICLIGESISYASLTNLNYPMLFGALCLVAGLAVTSMKTNFGRRVRLLRRRYRRASQMKPGF